MNAVLRLPLIPGQEIPDRADRDWATSAEVVAETGITYRKLDYWTRTGLLRVLDGVRPGTGHLHRYDDAEVARARGIRELIDAGLSLQTVRLIVDDFLTDGQVDLGPITITRTHQEAM